MKTLCCDVGTSSIRVAIIEYLPGNVLNTKPLAVANEALIIYNQRENFYEQSSRQIWNAFCKCASKCLRETGLHSVASAQFPIDAIAFSATCSLVIIDNESHEQEKRDVIMWMDHRATEEADIITQSGHKVLNQFGGTCSPEFSLAKLFWLFRNDRTRFDSAAAFMELSDWMTYRCSSFLNSPHLFPRSVCCVTCKWGYDSQRRKWREELFDQLGMNWSESLRTRIGGCTSTPGIRVASLGLTAALEMGFSLANKSDPALIESVCLSSSLIDAHSGVISMLVFGKEHTQQVHSSGDIFENVFCMISGTSTCHMVLNKSASLTEGVWGPYLDAIIPGYYLREAGQSATGQLIEHLINCHYNGQLPCSMSQIICDLNEQLRQKEFDHRTSLVVNPTFHGNRSPLANAHLKGAIYGFTLERTSLLDLYVATVEAIAYETRFIIERIEKKSEHIRSLIVTGGLAKNDLYLQLHADILGVQLVTFAAGEADLMLVGASLIAFTSTQIRKDDQPNREQLVELLKSMKTDSGGFDVRVIQPRTACARYHQNKYECYRRLLDCCLQIDSILTEVK